MYQIIVSCEHAGNRIPKKYAGLFQEANEVLFSHRGFDIGGLFIAKKMAKALKAPLFITEISRLLVDCNRSTHNSKIFSEYTKHLSKNEKEEILSKYYRPYRESVEVEIRNAIHSGKKVLHLSMHTFTPNLGASIRDFDVGVLYDPHRDSEALFSRQLLQVLRRQCLEEAGLCANIRDVLAECLGKKELQARANSPYKGASDGLTAYLRRNFFQKNYIGVEIEVNQRSF